jgi:DNA-directed RNA polymerase specialized sigma24 family protein
MTSAQVFDRIVQEQGAMIKRIASSYEAEPHLLEDLVQDIYFAIWRALPTFRGNAQYFCRAYSYQPRYYARKASAQIADIPRT